MCRESGTQGWYLSTRITEGGVGLRCLSRFLKDSRLTTVEAVLTDFTEYIPAPCL